VEGEDRLAAADGDEGEWIWEWRRSQDDGVGVRNKVVGHEKIWSQKQCPGLNKMCYERSTRDSLTPLRIDIDCDM
jgi:hypothetical protein